MTGVARTGISVSKSGAAGATGPAGPSAVSTDAGNIAKLGTDSLIFVPGAGVNAQSDSYSLVLADAGKMIEMGKGTAQDLTVPLNSAHAFPVGTRIDILQTGAGQVTVVATGGVTINAKTGLKLSGQWAAATLIKRATDTWVLVGALSA